MKNKTILLGILAIFIIIFLLYGSFFSWKEGLPDPIEKKTYDLINSYIMARSAPDNPGGDMTDSDILANIKLIGSPNSQITDILSSNIGATEMVDKFSILFGRDIYDPLADSLLIHYTFDSIKTINGTQVIENKSKNFLPSYPSKYNAVLYQHTTNPQPLNTIIDKQNAVVNSSCLYLNGLPRSDPSSKNSSDNGAYLMIPTLPSFYDSTGFIGISFSVWFRATDKNGNWPRLFDFANNRDSDNIVLTPSYNGNQCLGALLLNGAWNPYKFYQGDYVCDSNWRHVVWTISKRGYWSIYINNRLISKDFNLIPANVIRKRNYIGKSNWNTTANPSADWDDMYNGWMDDFRVYQRELTEADINLLYAKGGNVNKNIHVWTMSDTRNQWYNNNQQWRHMGGLSHDLGILSNTQMTIAFWLNVNNNYPYWRSIFLMGNDGANDRGTPTGRIPALYIYPNRDWHNSYYKDSVNLHLRFGTTSGWNDGLKAGGSGVVDYDPDLRFPLGTDMHIAFTFEGKTIKYYQNGKEVFKRTLDNNTRFMNNNSATRLYMCPWQDEVGIKLKNFQIFNRPLDAGEVMGVYNQVVCKY